jgi:predicted Fe-Mo cluster-binding NifX family protein
MRIAVTSQNFRTVTGHAGKARRFLVYEVGAGATVGEAARLDLPLDQAMHGFDNRRDHPLDGADVLITGGCGEGFAFRMARRGVRVVVTGETDPEIAVHALLAGCLKPAAANCHDHAEDHRGGSHSCGCHG